MKAMLSPSLLVLVGVLSGGGWYNNSIEPIGNNMGTHHQMGRATQKEKNDSERQLQWEKASFHEAVFGHFTFPPGLCSECCNTLRLIFT